MDISLQGSSNGILSKILPFTPLRASVQTWRMNFMAGVAVTYYNPDKINTLTVLETSNISVESSVEASQELKNCRLELRSRCNVLKIGQWCANWFPMNQFRVTATITRNFFLSDSSVKFEPTQYKEHKIHARCIRDRSFLLNLPKICNVEVLVKLFYSFLCAKNYICTSNSKYVFEVKRVMRVLFLPKKAPRIIIFEFQCTGYPYSTRGFEY